MDAAREPERDSWLHPDVEVRASDVAGRGLFAAADLPAGTVVVRLGGTLVDTATLGAMRAERADPVDSVAVDADRHLVVAPDSAYRFANHGCDPNLGWAGAYALDTLRDVAAGEELLHDYAMSTADPAWFLRCHCPSYRCRQMVEGGDWRMPQLQRRYEGHWTPYVQRFVDRTTKSQS